MRHLILVLPLIALASVSGCGRGPGQEGENKQPVSVAKVVVQNVRDFVDYTGRTNAKLAVTIQPRVTGYLVEMPFKEGSDVKAGETLFKIDPRPYEAQLKAAEAQVEQTEASLRYAKATNQRYKELEKKSPGAVSARELDQYQALQDQAVANLDLAKANLISAKLNLEWTVVKSPINGHISRYYLTLGNLVNQDSTQLTTVVSLDPMYVYFDMDEPTMLELNRLYNEGKITPSNEGGGFDILMALQGDEDKADPYPHKGTVNFTDNQVNPGTDSISVRGQFANPRPPGGKYLLVPGMFVRVRLPKGQPYDATLIIDRAVSSDQGANTSTWSISKKTWSSNGR